MEFQQQILFFLTQLSDQILLYAGVHEVPSRLSRAWQVAPDWTEGRNTHYTTETPRDSQVYF